MYHNVIKTPLHTKCVFYLAALDACLACNLSNLALISANPAAAVELPLLGKVPVPLPAVTGFADAELVVLVFKAVAVIGLDEEPAGTREGSAEDRACRLVAGTLDPATTLAGVERARGFAEGMELTDCLATAAGGAIDDFFVLTVEAGRAGRFVIPVTLLPNGLGGGMLEVVDDLPAAAVGAVENREEATGGRDILLTATLDAGWVGALL